MEKKVFLVLRERRVHQAGTLKGLVERGVRRETWVRKEIGVWKESLSLDLQDNQVSVDPLDHLDNRLTLMNVTLLKELLVHLDLQGYEGKWDRKVTQEIPVFSVKVSAHLDYLAPRVLKEIEDLLGQLAARETRVDLVLQENLEDMVLRALPD